MHPCSRTAIACDVASGEETIQRLPRAIASRALIGAAIRDSASLSRDRSGAGEPDSIACANLAATISSASVHRPSASTHTRTDASLHSPLGSPA